MSMSTYIVCFRAPDEKWEKMRAVYDSCRDLGVEPPSEVLEFFNDQPPDPRGVEIPFDGHEWTDPDGDSRDGIEVVIADLPPDLTHIRFVNSY